MPTYLAIAIGGALGAMTRYWLSTSVEKFNTSAFPLGTFSVNVLGSLLMGALFILLMDRADTLATYKPLLTIGFLGAMTTFSTFSIDALLLFQQGQYNTALFYVLGSVIVCLFAVYLGMQMARAVL